MTKAEFVTVRESPGKGRGVFAARDISAGTLLSVAHAIPFLTLPSGLWRLGLVFGSSMGMLDDFGRPAPR